jgi:hypothetical protein
VWIIFALALDPLLHQGGRPRLVRQAAGEAAPDIYGLLGNWELGASASQSNKLRPFAGSQGTGFPVIHTPEKSGLPLLVRGAGAVKSGLPPGVRGTPGVG